ncbi:hypothetical protein HON49_02670 [archaeon]|nr:hypothetical protein [archaeon]
MKSVFLIHNNAQRSDVGTSQHDDHNEFQYVQKATQQFHEACRSTCHQIIS